MRDYKCKSNLKVQKYNKAIYGGDYDVDDDGMVMMVKMDACSSRSERW